MNGEFGIKAETWDMIVSAIYAGGLLAAFLIGFFKVCLKKKPLYFRLIVYAIGGYALEGIGFLVNSLCTGYDDYINVSVISRFAYSIFLISANAGALDGFLDDTALKNKRARSLALIAPTLLAVSAAVYYTLFFEHLSLFDMITGCLLAAFNLVPLYLSLKYLLLPPDELGFLKVIRPINIVILAEAALEAVVQYLGTFVPEMINIISFFYVANFFLLTYFVLRGVKRWEASV